MKECSLGPDNFILNSLKRYAKYHELHGGDEELRKLNYSDMVNKYYDLVTSFTEYHWGQSFHFAPRWHGETLRESIKRFEHFIALQLGLKKGMKVLDVGCGIGGPLREIARFSSTEITGLNNNAYQISRGKELISLASLSDQCNFIKGDFMNMPFPDNTFDAAYAIEATIHAPDALGAYREIYRVLKPGQYFALDELCLTDKFDPNNTKHRDIKAEIELGCGRPDIRSTRECIQAMKDAGFEVILAKDLAEESECPWYHELDPGYFTLKSISNSRVGHLLTRAIVGTLEFLRIAPKGCNRLFSILQTASHGMLTCSREQIFTVTFFVMGRKLLKDNEIESSLQ
ncbi:cycloartenol-C-24-methyltransferase-like [Panicum virgatum]|uniref:cycloartenol-C-24-methyltransferase-like n=1 Tax=Panicum virgatum TaxID=38727 RepID=UPI0019D5A534|nr:cycloartenol-C-24-methyltransferase-like [Panicum virgatum]